MADPTPLIGFDRDSLRKFANRLDIMGALVATFAPDGDLIDVDRSTRRFYYRGGRFPDGAGGVAFEPDGFVVCTDDAISFVQWDVVNSVTVSASLDEEKYAIAEVTCAGGFLTHLEDLRDMNLHKPPSMFLDDLLDVEIYDPVEDDALRYDAALGLWVNRPMGSVLNLDDLLDVEIYDPVDLDVLSYDSGSGLWVNRPLGALPGSYVEDKLTSILTLTTQDVFQDGPAITLTSGTWLVMAYACVAGQQSVAITMEVYEGSDVYASAEGTSISQVGQSRQNLSIAVIVTPASSTTYTTRFAKNGTATASVQADAPAGTAGSFDAATRITAVQIA